MRDAIFLTTEWRNLVMLNYAVDPAILAPYLPSGTELDFFHDETFLSIVGLQFLRTRVCGIPFPFHTEFEEVNLRFYVRRQSPGGWRRGVVFIRELVPRRAIAYIARRFYGEPYIAVPMRHRIEHSPSSLRVEYSWRRSKHWEFLFAEAAGQPALVQPGSEEEFITEHYWGYTARPNGTSEYQVEHEPWQVWTATHSTLNADIATLYGSQFHTSLSTTPTSAFIAEGSPVVIRYHSALND